MTITEPTAINVIPTWRSTVEVSNMVQSRGIIFGSTFGDGLDSTDPKKWVERRQKRALEMEYTHDWVNFYVSTDGQVYEGAGWGVKVRWHQGIKTPDMEFPWHEAHYVLYLGRGEDFTPAASHTVRHLIDAHTERFGRCMVWTKDDLVPGYNVGGNPSYINGLAWWLHHGCAPFEGYVPPEPEQTEDSDLPWQEKVIADMQVLQVGDAGPEVRLMAHILYWQLRMTKPPGVNDQFTEAVEARVMAFQRERSLEDNGVVEADTWRELLKPEDDPLIGLDLPADDTDDLIGFDTLDPDLDDDPDDETLT